MEVGVHLDLREMAEVLQGHLEMEVEVHLDLRETEEVLRGHRRTVVGVPMVEVGPRIRLDAVQVCIVEDELRQLRQ
jgi:hypothetical protein